MKIHVSSHTTNVITVWCKILLSQWTDARSVSLRLIWSLLATVIVAVSAMSATSFMRSPYQSCRIGLEVNTFICESLCFIMF